MNFNEITDGIKVKIDSSIYNENVVHKCFYWYSGSFEVSVNKVDSSFIITLLSADESVNWNDLIAKIKRDLLDFKLREIVAEQTKTVRELIVAAAFANYDPLGDPQTEISDPVGFDITDIN